MLMNENSQRLRYKPGLQPTASSPSPITTWRDTPNYMNENESVSHRFYTTSSAVSTAVPSPTGERVCTCGYRHRFEVAEGTIKTLLTTLGDKRRKVYDIGFALNKKQAKVEEVQSLILKVNARIGEERDSVWERLATLRKELDVMFAKEASVEEMEIECNRIMSQKSLLETDVDLTQKDVSSLEAEIQHLERVSAQAKLHANLKSEVEHLEAQIKQMELSPSLITLLNSKISSNVSALPPGLVGDTQMGSICIHLLELRKTHLKLVQQLAVMANETLASIDANSRMALDQISNELELENKMFGCTSVCTDEFIEAQVEIKRQEIDAIHQKNDREKIQLINLTMDYDNAVNNFNRLKKESQINQSL